MPALHVIGEILGASGLTHTHTLSLVRVLDLLALDASSTRSFFCRWRLLLEGADDCDDDRDRDRDDAWSATWEVLRGERRGQTQVHCPASSRTIPLSYATTSSIGAVDDGSEQRVPLLLDVVWSHPIDVHIASSLAFSGWPHLELEVWSLDAFNQTQLCGVARVCIPSASAEYVLDVPLAHTISDSWLEWMAECLSITTSESGSANNSRKPHRDATQWASGGAADHSLDHDDFVGVVEPSGAVYLRIAVLQSGV